MTSTAVGRLLLHSFVYVDIFGVETDKSGWRSCGTCSFGRPSSYASSGPDVNDVLIADGNYLVAGAHDDGRDITSHTRFTSAWVAEAEGRQALFHHATQTSGPDV
jgi:hypothetical protein